MCFFKRKKKEVKKAKEEKVEEKPAVKETETKEEPKKAEAKETKVEEKEEVAKEEKARKSVYRVIYNKETKVWNIKKDGAKRIIDSRATKEEALKRVKELSENSDAGFVVYKKDGKFQKK